jgi:hypothetical protein
MMIFFNDPVQVEDPAERAVRMAVAMRDRVEQAGQILLSARVASEVETRYFASGSGRT